MKQERNSQMQNLSLPHNFLVTKADLLMLMLKPPCRSSRCVITIIIPCSYSCASFELWYHVSVLFFFLLPFWLKSYHLTTLGQLDLILAKYIS